MEEAAKVIQAKAQQGPDAETAEKQSKTKLNEANTVLTLKKADDIDTDNYFEALAAERGKLRAVQVD